VQSSRDEASHPSEGDVTSSSRSPPAPLSLPAAFLQALQLQAVLSALILLPSQLFLGTVHPIALILYGVYSVFFTVRTPYSTLPHRRTLP
jgi:hypothetical protein